MTSARIITCACCGRTGRHGGHDWIAACYTRWVNAGRPAGGPPRPRTPGQLHSDARHIRVETFIRLRKAGMTLAETAAHLGVRKRTVERYEADMRAAAAPSAGHSGATGAAATDRRGDDGGMTVPARSALLAMPTGGACRGRSNLMDPDSSDVAAVERAREICLSCPVFVACDAWLRSLPDGTELSGVIAATTPEERGEQTLPSKRCPHCDQQKALSEFHRNARQPDGLNVQCIDCVRARRVRRRPPSVTCSCGCGQTGTAQEGDTGWIRACYRRWLRAGKPVGGPPPSSRHAARGREEAMAA